jgi:hypothetical protein
MQHTLIRVIFIVLLLVGTARSQPRTEEVILFSPLTASEWSSDESTMDSYTMGRKDVLHWHVDVDHNSGEARYLIGWPRAVGQIPETLQNWQEWDLLSFRMMVRSNRSELPAEPVGMILFDSEGERTHTRPLTEAKLDEWVPYRIRTADVPGTDSVGRIQFYISESNYAHGDSLSFFIDSIGLTRYTVPALLDVVPESRIAFHDIRHLRVGVRLTGLGNNETIQVECEIARDKTVMSVARQASISGWNDVVLPLPDGLPPGDYAIRTRIIGDDLRWEERLIAIQSPWTPVQ